MPNYKIVHRAPALNQKREVRISATGTTTPSGFTQLAASLALDLTNKKALYHLVRDELYKIGVTNMQDLIISYETIATVPATQFHIWEKEVHLKVNDTYEIQVYDLPTALADPTVTAESLDEDIVTEAVSGKVVTLTAAAIGQTEVQITVLGVIHSVFVYVTEIP